MLKAKIKLLFLLMLFSAIGNAQNCTMPGVNPGSSFPVCPIAVFHQDTVANCVGLDVAHSGCPEVVTSSKSHWYSFRCFQTGPIGFLIRGISSSDDYDWILLDVTGKNFADVFTDPTLQISLNTYGTSGNNPNAPFPNSPTGCTATGFGDVHCQGDDPSNSPFNRMPTVIVGHDYLLMVTNWTQGSTLGYDLVFTVGALNITDQKPPHLESARAACDGSQITVKFNKRMKCSSLLANGTEFTITPPIANVISAVGIGCNNGFAMDSVLLTLDAPLPAGPYTVNIKKGNDANTVVDNCDTGIPDNEGINVVVYPLVPTPMDSLTTLKCAPDELQLVFRKKIRCNTIASDGTDFLVSGTTPISVVSATGNCDFFGLTNIIKVKLSAPILTKGNYKITLVNGSDGNTLNDECGKQTPAGSFIPFATKDTVNADFKYNILYGCKRDTINYTYISRDEVNTWKWNFDDVRRSSLQNPQILYGSFGVKTAQLIVSNGVCTDTSTKINILLDNELKPEFELTAVVCPGDLATIKNNSIGNIVKWEWDFGDNTTSNLPNPPPHVYSTQKAYTDVLVKLVVTNNLGCKDSVYQKITVAGTCFIAVPNAFTPNGDGLNDYLYPLNAYKAKNLIFRVYNRFGQIIFETKDWRKRWDGNFKGQVADPATYIWSLSYFNTDTNKQINQKGTAILLR